MDAWQVALRAWDAARFGALALLEEALPEREATITVMPQGHYHDGGKKHRHDRALIPSRLSSAMGTSTALFPMAGMCRW